MGAKDDYASASTTTFGDAGGAGAAGEARAFDSPRGDDGAPAAERSERSSTHRADGPRIDRMPTPGRRVHAPVDHRANPAETEVDAPYW